MSDDKSTDAETPKVREFSAIDNLRNPLFEYKSIQPSTQTNDPTQNKPIPKGKLATCLVIFLIIVAAPICFLYWLHTRSTPKSEIRNKAVNELALRYKANINWVKALQELNNYYVSDIQAALINKDGQPVLLKDVEISDVINAENKYIIHLNSSDIDEPTILFHLDADPSKVNGINNRRNNNSEYAVVALILNVRRATSEEMKDTSDTNVFVAEGHCLDLLPLD